MHSTYVRGRGGEIISFYKFSYQRFAVQICCYSYLYKCTKIYFDMQKEMGFMKNKSDDSNSIKYCLYKSTSYEIKKSAPAHF